MSASLFTPLQIGPYRLAHRVVMAPLTRMRAGQPGNVPRTLNAEYYGQRAAEDGLIIAEASQVSPTGQGMPATPGIHSPEQVAGWRLVTGAVHAKGGLIFLQLWHVGRIFHSSHQPIGGLPVAPSAIAAKGNAFTAAFRRAPSRRHARWTPLKFPALMQSYAQAARNAQAAGFDGVEIHAANGYLLEQFLQTRSNQRMDAYGGSIENRARLVIEVTRAVAAVWGPERVGIRLSPFGVANDSGEADPVPLYTYVIKELGKLGLAICILSSRVPAVPDRPTSIIRRAVGGRIVPTGLAGVLVAAGNFIPRECPGSGGRRRSRRCHCLRSSLHLQSGFAGTAQERRGADAL